MVAALGRALFLGGGMIGNVLGGALSGAGAAVGGLAQGVGSAVGGIGQGIGAAVGGALTPAPKTIVNNFGIAGSAAKGKVTGGGTLPAPKKTSAPAVNVNMPTEKLLVVAVNYLSSIDKTLQAQIKFERDAFVQQAQAERESSIESGGQKESIFTKLSDKFSGKSDDSTVKSRASTLTKTILAAAGIAGLGLLALGNLDTKELDRLKDSYKAFNEKFDFLGPLADGVASTGSIVGYLLGGLKLGIAGLVAEYLSERFTGKSIFENITGTGEEANGTQASAPQKPGSYDYAMAGGLAGYGAYRGVKTFGKIKDARANIAKIRAAPQVAPSLKGSGFRDPVTGRAVSRAAVTSGGGWLSGPKGQRWVAFLQKRFGKTFFAKKIMPLIGRVLASVAIAATGIAVIPGALLTLITVASSASLIYDIISAYWDWIEEEDALKDAQTTSGLKPKSDAMATPAPASTTTPDATAAPSSPATPTTSATAGQNKTITGVVEGGAGYTTVTYADGTTERRGGTLPARTNNPGNIMDGPLAKSYGSVGSSPSTNGPPVAVFPTREAGFFAMDALLKSKYSSGPIGQTLEDWATDPDHPAKVIGTAGVDPNKKYTDFTHDEKVRFMQALAKVEGFYAAGSGPKISSAELGNSGGLLSSAIGLGKGAMSAIGTVLRAGLGEMTPTSGSQLSGFNDTMKGNTSSAAPVQGQSTVTAQLARTSAQIQNAVDLGNADAARAATQQESAGASSIRQANASNDGKLECLNPNFPGSGAVEAYLQYHRLAA
jgi:hypothetical protein